MADAPLISTIIAVGLIPVAFLMTHAFLSGRKKGEYHKISGALAIIWDLSMSIGYMIMRTFGLAVEGSSLEIEGALLAYFIVHGTISAIVIALEFLVFGTGYLQHKKKEKLVWHTKLSKVLFGLWWFSFLTGEIFYIAAYVL